MPIRPDHPFPWRHEEADMILTCVRWYLDLPLSYRNVVKLTRKRGLATHASCVFRWVQGDAPELDQRCRPYLKPTHRSDRVDETYLKVKGQTIDFLLTAKRDAKAAKRFFRKALQTPSNPLPKVIHVDNPGRVTEPGRSDHGT